MTAAAEVGRPTTRPDLTVRGLGWRPHGRLRPTLQGIDLDLAAGERVLLVGPSGSGKSTLLRALAGLLDDSLGELTGDVRLGTHAPGARPGQVGLMLQDPMHSLVAEHVGRDAAFGPENAAQPPAAVRAHAAASLAAVGFPYGADHHSTALSGGQMQRLSLAGTLALDPDLLLLDEPTAMLDDRAAATVRASVTRVARERGLTVVVVEHRVEGWLELCDRLVVLGPGGVLLANGPVSTVLREKSAALAAAGVWVPGEPAPGPLALNWPIEPLPATNETALSLRGLRVAAPGPAPARLVVEDLDLDVWAGQTLALRGDSGSGKSTLLRTVAGFHPPRAGRVALGGEPVTSLSGRPPALAAAAGWLPQHLDQLVTARTVREEVLATSTRLYAAEPDRLAAAGVRADRILSALGLSALADADPYQLSVGEQRRMGLAAAVVHRPRLLLLDEPTVGQDRHTWAAVVGVIGALRAEGGAVLASTHDPVLAAALGAQLRLRSEPGPAAGLEPVAYAVREVIEPGSPPAARANPLALLLIALAAALGSFAITDWRVGLAALALVALAAPLAVRSPRSVLLRLVPVGLAALTVGWSALVFSDRGAFAPDAWPVAAREVLRIGYLVVPGVLLVPSLAPSRLGDALAQRARLPHRPVVAAAAALLRLQHLLDTWRQMTEIRTIRALSPGRSVPARVRHAASLTFALLVWTLRASQQMALSMDARGFASARRRTFALGSPWRGVDWVCAGLAVVLGLAPVVLTRLLV